MNSSENTMKIKKNFLFSIGKLLVFIFACFLLYYLAIFTMFLGDSGVNDITSYIIFLLGVPLLMISLFLNRINGSTKRKLWLIAFLIVIGPNIIYHGYKTYTRSKDSSSSDIIQYQPFITHSKFTELDEPSTLKFEKEYLPKLDGARAFYPVYTSFVQAVQPERYPAFGQTVHTERNYDFDSEINYHNTIPAYEKLIKRDVDMIFVAAPSADEQKLTERYRINMKFTPIGKEAFVFFVNANNPVNSLSSQQLRDIYSGKITNWQQVGGKNQTIQSLQRNEGSGSQTALVHFMAQSPLMTPFKENIIDGMAEIIERTASDGNYSNSIGFSFRYFTQTLITNDEIKLLKVDDIPPSIETIRSGDYPLTSEFYAVTLKDNPEPNVQKLLDWILSPQGQYLIEKTGYVGIGNHN